MQIERQGADLAALSKVPLIAFCDELYASDVEKGTYGSIWRGGEEYERENEKYRSCY